MIEIVGGQFAAGETKTFHFNGEYFELLDVQYTCDVYLMDKSGAQLSIMKSCEASFFSKPSGGYQSLQIYSPQAQYIRFFVGSGDAGTRRISSTVQVIDGERARTNAGAAFAASAASTAVAAQYPRVQLWNPAGSGRRLVLGNLSMSSGVSQAAAVFGTMAAEATDNSAGGLSSKLLGGAVGVGQVRWGNNAAFPPSTMFGPVMAASQLTSWKPTGVVVISPGFGLVVGGFTVNVSLSVNFEWFEELI